MKIDGQEHEVGDCVQLMQGKVGTVTGFSYEASDNVWGWFGTIYAATIGRLFGRPPPKKRWYYQVDNGCWYEANLVRSVQKEMP